MSPKKRFLKSKKIEGAADEIESNVNSFLSEKNEAVIDSWRYRIDSQDTHHVLIFYTEG